MRSLALAVLINGYIGLFGDYWGEVWRPWSTRPTWSDLTPPSSHLVKEAPDLPPVYERVLDVVRQIPRGQVATYGQIAQIVGGCTPRMVGFCLASLGRYPDEERPDVPWQRVINAQGKISPRGEGLGALLQRELLEAEGVEFSEAGRVSFRRFGWLDPYEGEER